MKKLLLFSILLGSMILTGCGQQKWLSQDELFSKKQECISYKDKISIQAVDILDSGFEVGEIFYSPIKNSCLYITKDKNEWIYNSSYLAIIDYFNNTIIESTFNEMAEFMNWDNLSFSKSKCFNKYIVNYSSFSEIPEEKLHDIISKYLNCKMADFNVKLSKLKWE